MFLCVYSSKNVIILGGGGGGGGVLPYAGAGGTGMCCPGCTF